MEENQQSFRSNTVMILVPGIFFGVALILRNHENLYALKWVLIAIGIIITAALVFSFTTVMISESMISIKNVKKSHEIAKSDIKSYNQNVSFSKGIESITWNIKMRNGGKTTISTDLFKDKEGLKKSLHQFLKNVPEE